MKLRLARTLGVCLATLAVVAHADLADARQRPAGVWQPGRYRGLVTGKSTTKDVVHVLGLPSWQGKPQEVPDVPGEEEWRYTIAIPQGRCCDLFFKNGVLRSVNLRLNGMMSGEAQQFFGSGFLPVRFRTYDDGSETGSGAICEDPKGRTHSPIEFAKRLVAMSDDRGIVKGSAL